MSSREQTSIVIATGNPHKVAELRHLFSGVLAARGLNLIGLSDLSRPTTEPFESGSTFEANATIKARSYAAQSRLMCLADDSGLEIDALGGKPGVISSHYATDGRETGLTRDQRDQDNLNLVLQQLAGVPLAERTARFVCVMVLAAADGAILASVRGTCEGVIGVPPDVPRGKEGFGYDPIFLVGPDHRLTSAQLSAGAKNLISHRGAAARRLIGKLESLAL
ncbi:MAG: non-canonical purine NTP pyrophosphatase [Planctomycetes bacterium]|nr:non-canonical purine NTP pyrophosphatase [Planctomycetota bacterium]